MRYFAFLFLIFAVSTFQLAKGQPIAQEDTNIYAALTLDANYDTRPLDFEVNVKGWICMDFGRECDTTVTGNSTDILINYYVVVKSGETTSFADLYIDQRIRDYLLNGFHNYTVLESYRISPHFSQTPVTSSSTTDAPVPSSETTPESTDSPAPSSAETVSPSNSQTIPPVSTTSQATPSSTQVLTTVIAIIRVDADYNSINVANFTKEAYERLSQWFLGYTIKIISVKSGSVITEYSITFPPLDRARVTSLTQFLAQPPFLGYKVLSSTIEGDDSSSGNNNNGGSSTPIGAIIGGIVGGIALIAIIAVIVALLIHKKKKKEKKGDVEAPRSHQIASAGTSNTSYLKGDYDPSMERVPLLKNISIGEELGKGKYGKVYKGIWNGTTAVALKINRDNLGQDEFLNETNILTKLNHPNVVRAIGLYVENEQTYLVMEYLSKGSLIDFLRHPEVEKGIGLVERINMCIHVAAGMGYLEDRRIVHRDLAARNLLVTEIDGKFLLKIADFGLSREVNTIYNAKGEEFPVKWSPPEVIQKNQYSSKSDIWSFGIIMWEIFSGVKIPYAGLSNIETVQYVLEGKRLEKPEDCPEEIYTLMLKCWSEDPLDRPTFEQLFKDLTFILDQNKTRNSTQFNLRGSAPLDDDKIQLYEFTSGFESKYGYIEDPKYIRTAGAVATAPKSPSLRTS